MTQREQARADALDRKVTRIKRPSRSQDAKARRLREQAAELDTRALHLTQTIATMDGERLRLFVKAESLRRQAEEVGA